MYYFRILADCVAKTMPALLLDDLSQGQRRSFRDQYKKARAPGANHPLRQIYDEPSFDWFEFLAGKKGECQPDGARDARTHLGAIHIVTNQSAHMVSYSAHHSGDIVGDLRDAICGFFGFLDHIVRTVARENKMPPLPLNAYEKWGYYEIWPPADDAKAMLPIVHNDGQLYSSPA
jgi:hypothetical protein